MYSLGVVRGCVSLTEFPVCFRYNLAEVITFPLGMDVIGNE